MHLKYKTMIQKIYPPRRPQGLLLDVMIKGQFHCQVRYIATGRPTIIEGKISPVFNADDIQHFVETAHPELINEKYNICFSNQAVR